MVFMGCGFTSGVGVCIWSSCVQNIGYIESIPPVPKDEEAVSLNMKGPLYS